MSSSIPDTPKPTETFEFPEQEETPNVVVTNEEPIVIVMPETEADLENIVVFSPPPETRTTNRATPTEYKVIQPLFQLDETMPHNPEAFTIDCSGVDMKEEPKNPEIIAKMKETFDRVGLVHLTNTGLTELKDMKRWATGIVENEIEYKAGANPRKIVDVEANVYDVGAPNTAWLHYHHEMAYVSKSPKYLSLFCKDCPADKGWTYVSDAVAATDLILQTEFGQKLKDKGVCYVRNLTDAEFYKNKDQSMIYNHWQHSFGTTNPDEVEPIANSRGLAVEWDIRGENRFLKTKYYVSAYEYFAKLDRNILFSSVADDFMWFDTWPGVDVTPVDDRPLRLTFGDDSDMTQEEKQLFVDVHDRVGFPIKWKTGEVAVMCNWRWLHGRPGFHLAPNEKRELGVLLGETFERMGDLPGK